MQTLYIDVYFLINFTVDLLALYFSSRFAKIPVSIPRLIISALIGGSYAVFAVLFISRQQIMYPLSLLLFLVMIFISSKSVGLYRKIKYAAAFFLFQIIIGGLVYYSYCTLDKVMNTEKLSNIGGENRKLLILSLIVLLSVGALKLIIAFFGSVKSEKNAFLIIEHEGRKITCEALVDSGNLAKDPFDKTPVMLINRKVAVELFGAVDYLSASVVGTDYERKSRIRVIPICFGKVNKILYGIKPDSVFVTCGKKRERIFVVLAVDVEEDNYGGYSALIPLSALEGVSYGNH